MVKNTPIKSNKDVKFPKPSELEWVETKAIIPNPHNPRMLFSDQSLKLLKESIAEVGILVPLLVYRKKSDGSRVILDGERRWRCALDLKLKKVPVNTIAEPNKISNLLTMFNIHNIREEWQIMPTALKLEVVMRLLKKKDSEKLAALTGLTVSQVHRCKKLLTFDKRYQDMMLAQDNERIKAEFFIEMYPFLTKLQKNFPDIFEEMGRENIIDVLIEKYQKDIIQNVLHFRDLNKLFKAHQLNIPIEIVRQNIEQFLKNVDMRIQDVTENTSIFVVGFENLKKVNRKLEKSLESVIPNQFYGNEPVLEILTHMKNIIEEKIRFIKGG